MSIFGVWMWPQSVSVLGVERVAGLCAQIGITDIYFLTKGLAGTVSYHSALAPRCNERDLLAELLEAAHARNIRVHAWLTSASDEHYKERFPQSGRCHYTRGKDKGLIALTDEAYIAYMKEIVTELCQGYAIDGLHLDYIRYNHLLYGWSDEDQARYAASGADIAHLREMMDRTFLETPDADANCIFDAYRAGDESALAFARTRRQDVARFARRMIAAAKAQARTEAQKIYDEWLKGEKDESSFADAAYEHSADGNYSDGGLYEDISKGIMVKEFEDWCFDESRKQGDHGMVKTKFGYHIMFYVDGEDGYVRYCRDGVLREKADTMLDEILEQNKVEADYKAIALANINLASK